VLCAVTRTGVLEFATVPAAEAALAVALVTTSLSVAGLQAVGVLSQPFGLGSAIALVGVAALAGAFLLFLLPETKQAPLPD